MGKKLFSLCMALALCLGLLPATALAADGIELYVGGQQIKESGCYENQNGTWTKVEGTGPSSGQFYYDAATATLTLNGATIQGGTSTGSVPYGAGIYAQCKDSESVSLTIELIGNNTITGYYGIYVNAEISENSNGTDASLTITGENNVSLEVSGSFYGIFVKSGTGNASVTIENASVDAKTTQTNSGYAGVCVQSGASSKDSPNLSLAVNGGSLTTSGSASGDGIQFVVGAHVATRATTSLTVTDNAIVDARNGGISASRTSVTLPTPTPTGNNSSGIVFDDKNGTVYGDVTLDESLTINQGETLTIPEGASLTSNDKLTNNGTIVNKGTLNGDPTGGSGTVVNAPAITTDSLPEGTVNQPYTATLTATGNNITWSVSGDLPAGLTLDAETDTITGTPTTEGSSTFTVKAENSAGVTTKQYTLNIKPATVSVTGVNLNKTSLSLTVGGTDTLTAKVEPDTATDKSVNWESSNPDVATVDNGVVTAKAPGTATITVTTADGSHTATCTVTVEKPYTPPPYIPPTYAVTAPETTGGTVTVSPGRASSGRRVTITTQPAPGYELESLTVLDSRGSEIALTDKGDGKYTFTMPASRVTVEASFTPAPLPFEDVAPGAWYESAVRYAYFHNIMEGMRETEFSPTTALTRAMAVQILYNLEGQPDLSSENLGYPYEDVDAQAWYGNAVYWARITGVATGYGDGTFQPGDSITRQEFAQMLYNYAKYKGYDLSAEGDLSTFPDANSIADWAEAAMSWANGNELINGHDDGTIDAAGIGTRAQAASILMKFDQNLAEN